jgi:hypothetical protein
VHLRARLKRKRHVIPFVAPTKWGEGKEVEKWEEDEVPKKLQLLVLYS